MSNRRQLSQLLAEPQSLDRSESRQQFNELVLAVYNSLFRLRQYLSMRHIAANQFILYARGLTHTQPGHAHLRELLLETKQIIRRFLDSLRANAPPNIIELMAPVLTIIDFILGGFPGQDLSRAFLNLFTKVNTLFPLFQDYMRDNNIEIPGINLESEDEAGELLQVQPPPVPAPRQPVPAPRQPPPVPAPRQPVPAPHQQPPVPAPRHRQPVHAPRQPVPAPRQLPPVPAPRVMPWWYNMEEKDEPVAEDPIDQGEQLVVVEVAGAQENFNRYVNRLLLNGLKLNLASEKQIVIPMNLSRKFLEDTFRDTQVRIVSTKQKKTFHYADGDPINSIDEFAVKNSINDFIKHLFVILFKDGDQLDAVDAGGLTDMLNSDLCQEFKQRFTEPVLDAHMLENEMCTLERIADARRTLKLKVNNATNIPSVNNTSTTRKQFAANMKASQQKISRRMSVLAKNATQTMNLSRKSRAANNLINKYTKSEKTHGYKYLVLLEQELYETSAKIHNLDFQIKRLKGIPAKTRELIQEKEKLVKWLRRVEAESERQFKSYLTAAGNNTMRQSYKGRKKTGLTDYKLGEYSNSDVRRIVVGDAEQSQTMAAILAKHILNSGRYSDGRPMQFGTCKLPSIYMFALASLFMNPDPVFGTIFELLEKGAKNENTEQRLQLALLYHRCNQLDFIPEISKDDDLIWFFTEDEDAEANTKDYIEIYERKYFGFPENKKRVLTLLTQVADICKSGSLGYNYKRISALLLMNLFTPAMEITADGLIDALSIGDRSMKAHIEILRADNAENPDDAEIERDLFCCEKLVEFFRAITSDDRRAFVYNVASMIVLPPIIKIRIDNDLEQLSFAHTCFKKIDLNFNQLYELLTTKHFDNSEPPKEISWIDMLKLELCDIAAMNAR